MCLGLSRLPHGPLVRDAIAADPEFWLGAEHLRRWGDDARMLVKLLDAGQRLPVHAHPHDAFAAEHLGRAHGKAEAWYILQGGSAHVGLQRDVSEAELASLVEDQDVDALLGLLHGVQVEPGDVVWVPPGELHAIGAGVFLLELQQPEDLSILLEWQGFELDGERDGHLDLGFDVALAAVNRRVRSPEELASLVRTAPARGSVFPPAADEYFRLERVPVAGPSVVDAGYAILVVARGSVTLDGAPVTTGSTHLVPASHGPVSLDGEGEVLVARPPAA